MFGASVGNLSYSGAMLKDEVRHATEALEARLLLNIAFIESVQGYMKPARLSTRRTISLAVSVCPTSE
jgi:hypothetical protein